MKSKPLFPNQTVTTTGLPPSQELIQIIQRIVGDILDNETESAAIRSELGYGTSLSGGDVTNSTTTLADTGLGFDVVSGQRYRFRFFIDFYTGGAGQGIRLTLDGPALTYISYQTMISTGATTRDQYFGLGAYNLPAGATTTSVGAARELATIEGVIRPSADGTLTLMFASETGGSIVGVRAASSVTWSLV